MADYCFPAMTSRPRTPECISSHLESVGLPVLSCDSLTDQDLFSQRLRRFTTSVEVSRRRVNCLYCHQV